MSDQLGLYTFNKQQTERRTQRGIIIMIIAYIRAIGRGRYVTSAAAGRTVVDLMFVFVHDGHEQGGKITFCCPSH